MPKEKVADQAQQRWHTEVSWRRKPCTHEPGDEIVCDDVAERGSAPGHVQIATVNLDSPFEFPEREHGTSWEAGERFDGWRVTLDEAGIDHLIKTLHKAKRQAFGLVEAQTETDRDIAPFIDGDTRALTVEGGISVVTELPDSDVS